MIEGLVVKTETLSNQDGSVNLVFVEVTGLKREGLNQVLEAVVKEGRSNPEPLLPQPAMVTIVVAME